MEKFNQQFEQEMKQQRPVSEMTRKALDSAYLEITSTDSQTARTSKQTLKIRKLLLAAIVFLIVGGFTLLSYSPLNDAVSKWLSFDWLSSKTLSDANFVSKQTAVFTDQEVMINLEEVFADQTQIGLQFTVQLPANSSLLSKEMSEYILNFALYNGDGTLLADANSGLMNDGKKALMTGSYSFESQKNLTAKTIDLTVLLHGNLNEKLPELNDAIVKITGISAKPQEGNQEGFHQLKETSIKGQWNLPIESKAIKSFPVLEFKNISEIQGLTVISAQAYPSSFTLTMAYTETLQKILRESDSSTITLTGSNNEGSFSYSLSQMDTQQQDGETVKILVFEYGGYDDFHSVSIELSDTTALILEKH